MEALEARGRMAGERAAGAATERLAAAAREALPGLEVAAEAGRVTIAGRGLARRMRRDPALAWLGGYLR